jgi:hypothetical protein
MNVISNSEAFMPASVIDKSALTAQKGTLRYTASTSMSAGKKASIIGCVRKGSEMIKQEGY